jgi:hypothetical protein
MDNKPLNPPSAPEEHRIKSYHEGKQDAYKEILDWVEENRTFIEFDAGDGIYRDHFSSEDLVAFVDSRK